MANSFLDKSKYKWVYAQSEKPSDELINACGSGVLARLMLNRNIVDAESIEQFISPEKIKISCPYVFPDMEKAVKRIEKAINANEHVLIYGDFDADGVTSTSLLYKVLRYLGANVSYYIPDRVDEGHGLNKAAVLRLISSRQIKVIITVDCGISNLSEVKLAQSFGVDVIITDHHDAPDEIPPAYAVINPKVLENPKDLAYLAGVGVAYKLSQALLENFNKSEYLDEVLFLVVLGSIADVVPLLGENRALVTKGLKLISRKTPKCIRKIFDSAGYKPDGKITADMFAFGVAPRVNAAGRLEKADVAVEFLTEEDEEKLDSLLNKLNYYNRNRQQICESTFIEAELKLKKEIDLEKDKAVVLGDKNWHPGVIGIVASKLLEKYNRPCFLVSLNVEKNEAACSARGIEGIHLQKVLTEVSEMFERFGGHSLAAGCTFDLKKHTFDQFRQKITSVVNKKFKAEFLLPTLNIDVELYPEDIKEAIFREIEKLEPFGEGNSTPVFSMSRLRVMNYKTIGQNNNHLKIFLQDKDENLYDAVWWQNSSFPFDIGDIVNIAFCLKLNNFGGKNYIQFEIKDIRLEDINKVPLKKEEDKEDYQVKWLDHRAKINPENFLANFIKTSGESFLVYAEFPETRLICEKDDYLKNLVIDRNSVKPTENLLFFDMPPDLNVFSKIIKNSNPRVIHFAAKKIPALNSLDLLKKISGMFKYAYSNKNGEIVPDDICAKLGISLKILLSLIKTLESAEVLKIKFLSRDIIRFDFIGSSDVQKIITTEEYKNLSDLLNTALGFYKKLSQADLSAIKNSIEKISSDFISV